MTPGDIRQLQHEMGYAVYWDETYARPEFVYSTLEAAQEHSKQISDLMRILPAEWSVTPSDRGGYNIIHDGKTVYYDNLGDTEQYIMRHTTKDYPLDEGLPPPESGEKGAVDAVIELEVTDGGVTHLLTGDNKAWMTSDGGVTWQEAPMPQTPLAPPGLYTSSSGNYGTQTVTAASTSGRQGGIIGTLKSMFTKPEPITGFKVYGNHFLATFSNNFEDREGELFTQKAIDDYIGRLDSGIVPQPELWVWHKGGSVRIGEALTTFRVGAFIVSAGEFDSTPTAQHAKGALAKEKDLGMSHGFTYNPAKFDGRHYNEFNTFEISVLPRKAAANLFTTFEEIKAMGMTKEQRDFIARITGKSADELEKSYEEATKALEATGLAYKDFTAVPDEEPAVSEKTIAEAAKTFAPMIVELTESQGELANMQLEGAKALTTLKTHVDGELAKANKAISDLTALVSKLANERPRIASTDDANTVESSNIADQIKAAIQEGETETVAGIPVYKKPITQR